MKGDFSRWRDERQQNFNGVLHQQGKVLLDADWNAQTTITNDWQDTASQDIIGAGVAAIPSDSPEAFKINSAQVKSLGGGGEAVELSVMPGRAWVDGLLVYLDGKSAQTRRALYLQPPVQSPAFNESSINAGIRDAVVLEVWREEINAFQLPDTLIEPALGGPDTTERVHTETAFRLMRLTNASDTCDNIIGRLKDNFDNKGHLSVKLEDTHPINGDCPVVAGGGYTGFEHNLYRVEIAQVNAGLPAMFKWSQYNGGLVGRGIFSVSNRTLTITANSQAIINSGLTDFYLEAIQYDPNASDHFGHWRVTYGAKVTLNNGVISLPDPAGLNPPIMFAAIPTSTQAVFFRLWNDVRKISDFSGALTTLQDGIRLNFDAVVGANYVAGDYWTFPVRAGEIPNQQLLIDHQPPEGFHYHRVPLAVLTWPSHSGLAKIEDCRRIFHPLTKLSTCCSYRVGDGIESHGDFDKIQTAIEHLTAGGEICVLPGVYHENITITRLQNITIKGCGARSRIEPTAAGAAITVAESQHITIESLSIHAQDTEVSVLLDGPTADELKTPGKQPLLDITLKNLYIRAAQRSAIEAHVGQFITIRDCFIQMKPVVTAWPGIFLVGDDALIENNVIYVPSDPNVGAQELYTIVAADANVFKPVTGGRGGVQLGGTSDRVRVINNLIHGGVGSGITLGHFVQIEGANTFKYVPRIVDDDDPCTPGTLVIDVVIVAGVPKTASAGNLTDIRIERNRIFNMGLNGIGVAGFFDLSAQDDFISVHGLTITGNEIRNCLNRPLAPIPGKMLDSMGYGGIALADVEYLVVRDNVIKDNGPNYLEPICGIFVLHGEGIEISRNLIMNNGAKTAEPSMSAKVGRRGGINVVYAIAPAVVVQVNQPGGKNIGARPTENGFPAVKVHENVVSVPLGQALALTALGPVSVVGNQFTSLGMILNQNSPTFMASTVMIFNLGMSNELYFQLLGFMAVKNGQVHAPTSLTTDGSAVYHQPGLDDERLGAYLANGNVLFANNQCLLELLDRGFSFAISSIFIFSLDDVGFHANQCDCDLLDDIIIAQAIMFGISLRASDNRFKEGVANAVLSAITIGLLNTTTDNQSTHCLMVLGWPPIQHSNVVLLSALYPRLCAPFTRMQEGFGGRSAYNQSSSSEPGAPP